MANGDRKPRSEKVSAEDGEIISDKMKRFF